MIGLGQDALDVLMPMAVAISPTGHITVAGRSVRRVIGQDIGGRRFLEVFELRRPRSDVQGVAGLAALAGRRLQLCLREPPHTALKGVLVPLAEDQGLLVNLSFGLSLVEATERYSLTDTDFSVTDLATEMLFLIEAKNAVMAELKCLNQRLRDARNAAQEQASTDPLTGLRNRRSMQTVLDALIEGRVGFGLMHVDLDYFKQVNDTLGHAAGDHVLTHAAAVLLTETRETDTVARVGGDEFVILFKDLTDVPKLEKIAQRIVERLEEPIEFEGRTCRISGSVGITVSDYYAPPVAEALLADADRALYQSKHAGRARATVFVPDAPA